MNHTTLLMVAMLAAASMFAGLTTTFIPAQAQRFTAGGSCTLDQIPGLGPVGGNTGGDVQLGLPRGFPGASALPSLGVQQDVQANVPLATQPCTGHGSLTP
jgi:hypothetical protein